GKRWSFACRLSRQWDWSEADVSLVAGRWSWVIRSRAMNSWCAMLTLSAQHLGDHPAVGQSNRVQSAECVYSVVRAQQILSRRPWSGWHPAAIGPGRHGEMRAEWEVGDHHEAK